VGKRRGRGDHSPRPGAATDESGRQAALNGGRPRPSRAGKEYKPEKPAQEPRIRTAYWTD
jgi:hypothetical protein